MLLQETFTLYNGVEIPKVGFGTWQIPNGDICYNACLDALKAGYVHIDTAEAYGNEESVARAIRTSGLKRSDVFITTKLPSHIKTYEEAKRHLDESLERLDTDYIDLYLIHAPWPWSEIGKDCKKGNREVWRAFEEAYLAGKVRAIGISNFNVDDMKNILDSCMIKPMVNQVEFHIGHTLDEDVEFCKKNGILVEAYSPIQTGKLLNKIDIMNIANKYQKTVAQICIRYCLQKGTLPLPKSQTTSHIYSNTELDFEISKEDMEYLDRVR